MAKFILQFNGTTIKEISIHKETMSIGKKEDNDIVIDNLAVSSYHARLAHEKDTFILEDLDSLCGTFVNGKKVMQGELNDKDQVLIGKHTLVFHAEEKMKRHAATAHAMGKPCAEYARENEDFFTKNLEQKTEEEREKEKNQKGIISCIVDNGQVQEVMLEKKVTVIGKGEKADIKIGGLFLGENAILIKKESGDFYISRGDGRTTPKLNGEKVKGHIRLKDNDCIEIGSHTLRFFIKDS